MGDAIIRELGNGLPGPRDVETGCYVPGTDGEIYRVLELVGPIHTGERPGAGNYVRAVVELADWGDVDEGDEYPNVVEMAEV